MSTNLPRFDRWDHLPPIKPIPVGMRNNFPLLGLKKSEDGDGISIDFGPAIIICLGETGNYATGQWLNQLDKYAESSLYKLRVLSLSHIPQEELPETQIRSREIVLIPESDSPVKQDLYNQRISALSAFQEASNYRKVREWLKHCLLDLQRNIQVYIVGSAQEPEISLVGPILQLIRTTPDFVGSYLNVIVALSMQSLDVTRSFSHDESYAALREIGRLTFSGWHKFPDLPYQKNQIFRNALIDHLFLLDDSCFHDSKNADFRRDLGQSLSELLYIFNHPSSRSLWENLINDASISGRCREKFHQPVAHALGIKTFFLPNNEIHDYLSVRLAKAVLFGERKQDSWKQLISKQREPSGEDIGDLLASRWMLSEDVYPHQIFDWLWKIQELKDLMIIPRLTFAHKELFIAKLAIKLSKYLNDSGEDEHLGISIQVLIALQKRLDFILNLGKTLLENNESLSEWEILEDFLVDWKRTILYLKTSIQKWQKILDPGNLGSTETEITQTWGNMKLRTSWKEGSPKKETSEVIDKKISHILSDEQKRLQRRLEENMHGEVRLAVTGNKQNPLGDVEKYYEESVRPELTHNGLPFSSSYEWVRSHLAWWVRVESEQEPEIMLICWPENQQIEWGDIPPAHSRFTHGDGELLCRKLISITSARLNGVANELSDVWFKKRLEEEIPKYISSAEDAFLNYDQNLTSAHEDADGRRYYVIGSDRNLTGKLLEKVFPHQIASQVNELDQGDPARFTALNIRLNIPFDAVNLLQTWKINYHPSELLHWHFQERISTRYEKLANQYFGEKILFPPDFRMWMTDEKLVTLFFQCVFSGLIELKKSEIEHTPFWVVKALDGFPVLHLASKGDGLLNAFQAFMVELPNAKDVDLNPTNHFHSLQKKKFLGELHRRARKVRNSTEFQNMQELVKKDLMADWKSRGERDILARAFSYVMEIELQEPVWEGWWD